MAVRVGINGFPGNLNAKVEVTDDGISVDGNVVKVLSWYDNERGYSSRSVDLLRLLVKRGL